MRSVVRQVGWVIGVVSLVGMFGCESRRSERIKLVIPAYETTPAMALSLEVSGRADVRRSELREPLGNVVYLAVRACEGVYSPDDRRRGLKLDFVLEQGEVVEASSQSVGGRSLAEKLRGCLVEQMKQGGGADRGDETLPEGRLDVSANVQLSPQ